MTVLQIEQIDAVFGGLAGPGLIRNREHDTSTIGRPVGPGTIMVGLENGARWTAFGRDHVNLIVAVFSLLKKKKEFGIRAPTRSIDKKEWRVCGQLSPVAPIGPTAPESRSVHVENTLPVGRKSNIHGLLAGQELSRMGSLGVYDVDVQHLPSTVGKNDVPIIGRQGIGLGTRPLRQSA